MFRYFATIFLSIIVVFCAIGGYLYFQGNSSQTEDIHANLEMRIPTDIPSMKALLVQADEESGSRRILDCNASGCIPKHPPKHVGPSPLSDGTAWYRYAEHVGKQKGSTTVLDRVDSDGKVQTISEENSLVKPRGMVISNDGAKVAYFLDNIHDASKLTEIWAYDSKEGASKVIVEKLHRPDIASNVRWNASSRVIWFLQDDGNKKLIVAPIGGGTGAPGFTGVNWNEHAVAVDAGVMDIHDNMSLLAFAQPSSQGNSKLYIVRNNERATATSMKGNVVSVRWLENDSLLYAVQDGKELTFWMANTNKAWPIARMDALFESAHSSSSATLATFIASPRQGERHLYVLQIATGLIKDQLIVPYFPGKTFLVQAREPEDASASAVAGITSVADDSTLVAFIEDQVSAIVSDSNVQATRILVTDISNTSYIDYTDSNGKEQRILVTIQDIINPEWKVIAKYITQNGIWSRIDATGKSEPKVLRLYEWEKSVSQWILKQSY